MIPVSEQPKNFPEFYVTAPQPCPYLPGRKERKLFTHISGIRPRTFSDGLLRNGFRRSQSIAYTPYCEGCLACISVRVLVNEFAPGRTMRRTLERNQDLRVSRIPAAASSDHYALFQAYIAARHDEGGMAGMSALDYKMMVEDSTLDTFLSIYRMPGQPAMGHQVKSSDQSARDQSGKDHNSTDETGKNLAIALCDRLSDGISMVYSFYDPSFVQRSLGTFMILDHIAEARRLNLPYLYLGYWIAGSPKMSYKARFLPQERMARSQAWMRA